MGKPKVAAKKKSMPKRETKSLGSGSDSGSKTPSPRKSPMKKKTPKSAKPSVKKRTPSRSTAKKSPSRSGRPKSAERSTPSRGSKKEEKKSTPKPKTSPKASSDDEKEYEIDRILEIHYLKNREKEFLVKWVGYSSDESTWEPEEALPEALVEAFMDKLEKKNVPGRRLSRRRSTMEATRRSETRQINKVKSGRVEKRGGSVKASTKRKIPIINGFSMRPFQSKMLKNARERMVKTINYKGAGRAALLGGGMAISIGAALFLTNANTFNYNNLGPQIMEILNTLRSKVLG